MSDNQRLLFLVFLNLWALLLIAIGLQMIHMLVNDIPINPEAGAGFFMGATLFIVAGDLYMKEKKS